MVKKTAEKKQTASPRQSWMREKLFFAEDVLLICVGIVLPVVAAYGVLLWEHAGNLLRKDHFQFFPVYLAAAVILGRQRYRDSEHPAEFTWRVEPVSMGLGVIALAVAWWIWSPWLSAVSFLLLGNSLLSHFPSTRQCWRLLILLIPLPLGLDEALIQKLQLLSSQQASRVLDVLGVPHLMQGNILELDGRRLFVEEACSGVSSVYLLLAAALFYLVLVRSRMVQAIPLLISVVWWALVANVLRLVVIAVAHERWGSDLTSGVPHELTGITTTLTALLAIFSTNSVIHFLFRSTSNRQIRESSSSSSYTLTPTALWNTITTSNLSLIYPTEYRGLSVMVSRNLLLAFLIFTFVGVSASGWGIGTYANWKNSGLEADRAAFDSEDSDVSTGRFASLNNLSGVLLKAIPGIQISEAVVDSAIGTMLSQHGKRTWRLSTPFARAELVVSGPFSRWQDVKDLYSAKKWKTEDRRQTLIPGYRGEQMVVNILITENKRRLRSYTVMLRPTGELVSPKNRTSADNLVSELRRRASDSIELDFENSLWHIELQCPQDSSLNIPSDLNAEQELFGTVVSSIVSLWGQTELPELRKESE